MTPINNTSNLIVVNNICEDPNRLQTTIARKFERYGKLKESDIPQTYYLTRQSWSQIRIHIKDKNKYRILIQNLNLKMVFKNCQVTMVKYHNRYILFINP